MATNPNRNISRALARARPTPTTAAAASAVSHPARVGDVIAIYAAPVEPRGIEPQGVLAGGTITDDLLTGRGLLADRGALDALLGDLPPGAYDMVSNFVIEDREQGTGWRRTEVRTVWISASDSPKQRGHLASKQLQTVARDVVKDDSKLLVRIAGAVLFPSGAYTVPQSISKPSPLTTPTQERRSESARKGWATRRARAAEKVRAAAARAAAARRRAAERRAAAAARAAEKLRARRRASAAKGARTRALNRAWYEVAADFLTAALAETPRKPRKPRAARGKK